jgi:hypothetical protein
LLKFTQKFSQVLSLFVAFSSKLLLADFLQVGDIWEGYSPFGASTSQISTSQNWVTNTLFFSSHSYIVSKPKGLAFLSL